MQAGAVRSRASVEAPADRPGAGRRTPARDAPTRAFAVREHVAVAARQGCGYNAGPVMRTFHGT